MAESQYQHTIDGQEVEEADLNLLGMSALMDDRVLAELLRMAPAPNSGAFARAIIPHGYSANPTAAHGTVRPSGSADGRIKILPFRAIIGSRTPQNTIPTPSSLDPWRDIRSAVYAASDDTVNLGHYISIAANSSGNPRWDLIYAALTVDTGLGAVTRYVKPTTGATPVPTSVVVQKGSTVSIGVAAGTPASSPAVPSTPSDVSGTYNIPIAYVRVPNGFGASSTVLTTDILDAMPIAPLSRLTGASTVSPARGSSTVGPTTAQIAAWGQSGVRTLSALPISMIGSESVFFALDLVSSTSTNWSHANGAVLDATHDWRGRIFKWTCGALNTTAPFAWNGIVSGVTFPNGIVPTMGTVVGMGQSFQNDAAITTGNCCVAQATPTNLPTFIASSTGVEISVNPTNGNLILGVSGLPGAKLFFWIDATAPYVNL